MTDLQTQDKGMTPTYFTRIIYNNEEVAVRVANHILMPNGSQSIFSTTLEGEGKYTRSVVSKTTLPRSMPVTRDYLERLGRETDPIPPLDILGHTRSDISSYLEEKGLQVKPASSNL